ncbi:MAG: HDOD domain-containing protein [Ideonella sp.]|nr:HDOD domain-containing protein [Ideonella sp.]MCC7457563.1 HDOD domain-containing protein [Nitrospira sp.]
MAIESELRSLEVDIPSQPEPLLRLTLLMADDEADMAALAALIEADMALAAAVLKAVNSSLYGLNGRVQSVQQAITYLGLREVAGITLEMGLRAVFPPAPELDALWRRASQRGLIMGRLAQALQMDAWAAHSAGLFEECGKAVLFRHAPERYRTLLRSAADDVALCELEIGNFGVSHDALGAALCESWGLGAAAVVCVRHHVAAQADQVLPQSLSRRGILALSVLAHALVVEPEALDERAERIAPQCDVDTEHLLRAARKVQGQVEDALAHGR